MVADTGPSSIDTLTMEDSGSFTSADPQVDIRHPDETAPLMPVTVLSNRQRCLSQCCFLSDLYYLFFPCSRGYVNFMHDFLLDFADPIITQKKVGRYLID